MQKDHHHGKRRHSGCAPALREMSPSPQPEDQGSKSHPEFKCFYMDHTQGEVNDAEVQVPKPSVLDDLLGVSSTSMDVDPSSVNGETELNAYMRMQQVANDTDPLMWWKQHQQEFPRLARMTRQYLTVPARDSLAVSDL